MSSFGFFATAGRGTEKFVEAEVVEKFQTVGEVDRIDGKVFFDLDSTEVSVEKLLKLKSVERLFIKLLKTETSKCNEGIVPFLKRFVDEHVGEFESCLSTLKLFLTETRVSKQVFDCSVEEDFDKTSRKRGKVCPPESTECEARPAQKKKRFENGLATDLQLCCSENSSQSGQSLQGANFVAKAMYQSGKFSSASCRVGDTDAAAIQTTNEEIETMEDTKVSQETGAPPCITHRSQDTLTFRVSCKCRGRYKKKHLQIEIVATLGKVLAELWQLQVDLRNPSFELFIHVNDSFLVVGIPVTPIPLSRRPYLKTIGLRSSVAWIIGYLASIKKSSLVVDPMCGAATILLEAAMSWPEALYIGCDNNKRQLEIAQENIRTLQALTSTSTEIQLIEADATNLEFLHSMVDVILCDIPFGHKFGRKEEIQNLYPKLLVSWDHILRLGGTVVILCSCDLLELVMRCVGELRTEKACCAACESTRPSSVNSHNNSVGTNKPENLDCAECLAEETLKLTGGKKWKKIALEHVNLGVMQACICVFEKVL